MILFLDFDGVLHPKGCTIDLYFCKLSLLEAWLRERHGVDVVISSSWREAHPLNELREFFAEDLQPRVIGATPIMSAGPGCRQAEAFAWLGHSENPQRAWIALDDDASLFQPGCKELILCAGSSGLSENQLHAVDSFMKKQVASQRAIDAVIDGATWLKISDGQRVEWFISGRLFAIERGGQLLAPLYAFDDSGEPHQAVSEVLAILHGYTPSRVAAWFESTSSTLGGKRPRELLASDPGAVISAAQSHAAGPQHG